MPNITRNDSLAAPPPFRLTSSSTVELRQGGGCISIVGAPFFAAGVLLALAAAGLTHLQTTPEQVWVRLLLALMSIVFLTVGGGMLFGRRWLTLDIGSGSLIRNTQILFPLWTERRNLGEFNAVVIAFKSDSEAPDQYPVQLRAANGRDFVLSTPAQFEVSRTQAEFFSRFLRLPLADATTDHEVILNPEQASATLQERVPLRDPQREKAERPATMRSAVNESTGETTIVIPPRRSRGPLVFAAVMCFVLMLVVLPAAWRFASHAGTPAGVRLISLAFVLFFFVLVPLVAIGLGFGAIGYKTIVTASPAGLVIRRGGLWRTQSSVVSAADILDVDYSTMEGALESVRKSAGSAEAALNAPKAQWVFATLTKLVPTRGIAVKSRQGFVTFGEGLAAEELRFLKSVLIKALAGKNRNLFA